MPSSIKKLLKSNSRIAILTPTLWEYSGIDRVVESQAQELHKAGKKVTVFCFDQKLSLGEVPVVVWMMPHSQLLQRIYRLVGVWFNWPLLFTAVKKLATYEVVIATQYPMTLIAMLSRIFNRHKYIYWDYGVPPLWSFQGFVNQLYIFMFNIFTMITVSTADQVVSISQFLSKQIELFYSGQQEVVYPKITLPSKPSRRVLTKVIKKLNIAPKTQVILYLGRLSPHKGIDILIKSCLALSNKKWYLILAGQPTFQQYSEQLRHVAKGDPRIVFLGSVPDEELAALYGIADVYATASKWEGYNLPLATAVQLGKKVVAFDIGAHAEFVPAPSLARFDHEEKQQFSAFSQKLAAAIRQ